MMFLRVLQWLAFFPVHLGVTLVRYPLAPIAVYFFSTKDKRYLTFFRFLETLDNDLFGDISWQIKHLKGDNPFKFWNRVRWLWRNGGNAVNYLVLGCDYYDMRYQGFPSDCDFRGWYIRDDGYWLYRKVWFGGLEIFLGWNLYGEVHNKSKFVLTIRKFGG